MVQGPKKKGVLQLEGVLWLGEILFNIRYVRFSKVILKCSVNHGTGNGVMNVPFISLEQHLLELAEQLGSVKSTKGLSSGQINMLPTKSFRANSVKVSTFPYTSTKSLFVLFLCCNFPVVNHVGLKLQTTTIVASGKALDV